MANRYWVGGTGSWTDTAHWSTTSGGTGGSSVPNGDYVYFDANSGSGAVTFDANMTVSDINMTGYAGTFSGSGNLYYGAGKPTAVGKFCNASGLQNLTVYAYQGTLDCNGGTLYNVYCGQSGGSLALAGNFSGRTFNINRGTVSTGAYDVSAQYLGIDSGVVSFSMGSGIYTITNSIIATGVSSSAVSPGTSIINFSGSNISGGSPTFNTLYVNSSCNISSSPTFNNLLSNATSNISITASIGTTITITNSFVSGNSIALVSIFASSGGWSLSTPTNTVVSRLSIRNCTLTSGNLICQNSIDAGSNVGNFVFYNSSGALALF